MEVSSEITKLLEKDTTEFIFELESIVLLLSSKNVSELRATQPLVFKKISEKFLEICRDPSTINFDDLLGHLNTLLTNDPFLFENNIYKIIAECMMRQSTTSSSYEIFLKTVIKIFSKDVNQFVKKLLNEIDNKLENFAISKKRKRKSKRDSVVPEKKVKLTDGSSSVISSIIENMWPQSIVIVFEEIISRLNVSQVINLWEILNEALIKVLDRVKDENNENELFKIDLISTFLCSSFSCCRIHEQLVYKKSEISTAIQNFNQVQNKFYQVIFNAEHNNRIMSAFLKVSYEYENFLMLYFYHYDSTLKSELDDTFLADNSRISSSKWKIIQQRIRNFGKSEEKNYSNLLCIQQCIKAKLFDSNVEIEKDFLTNILTDNNQTDMIMKRKDVRAIFLSLLNEKLHYSLLFEYLYYQMSSNEDVSSIVSILPGQSIESLATEVLNADETEKVLKILQILPLSALSSDKKKATIEKIQNIDNFMEHSEAVTEILINLLKNDSYKNFIADFPMKTFNKKFNDISKFAAVYETIFRQNLRRLNKELMEQFEWIVSPKKEELFLIFAKSFVETNFRTVNVPEKELNNFKVEIITTLSSMINEADAREDVFLMFSKLCIQNMSLIDEEMQQKHLKLLNSFLKSSKSLQSHNSMELFKIILQDSDSKKLNLSDETKGSITKALKNFLFKTIEANITKDEEISTRVESEEELILLLSTLKKNFRLDCAQLLESILSKQKQTSCQQRIYCFKIFQVFFKVPGKQNNRPLITKFMSFFDEFLGKQENVTDVDLLCAIFDTFNEIIRSNKQHVDNTVMDNFFMFLIDKENRPTSKNVDEFCKYYDAIGQFLYLVGNLHHTYFKARVPHFFKAYQQFLEDIYFYRNNNEDEELTTSEIFLLQKLTLQLENILKMITKQHAASFSIVMPYIISPIINVFSKNPKMLTLGDKFKKNIQNISCQLLGIIDDRARKHIYAIVDEQTRNIYAEFISEAKSKEKRQ